MSDQDAIARFLDELYPYREETQTFRAIPEHGRSADDVLAEVRSFARARTPSATRARSRARSTAATTTTTTC